MQKRIIPIATLFVLSLLLAACQGARTTPAPASPTSPPTRTPWPSPTHPPRPTPTITPTPLPGIPLTFQPLMDSGIQTEPSFPYNYPSRGRPSIYIIASQEEIQKLDWIPADDRFEPLQSLNYSKRLAIVVFQDVTPSSGYTTEIKRITIQNNTIYVEAEMRDPSYFIVVDGLASIQVVDRESLPYQVVTIDREGLPGKATFVLAANTELLEEIEVDLEAQPVRLSWTQGTPVPFGNLLRSADFATGVSDAFPEKPGQKHLLYIIASQADTEKLAWIPHPGSWYESRSWFDWFDYSRELIIALFPGIQPTTGYTVQIMHITLLNDRVYVVAELRDPSYGLGEGQAPQTSEQETLPVHMVTIDREELPVRSTFVLIVNGEILEEVEVNLEAEPVYLPVIIDQ
jgi:hypothetical protein